MAISSHVLLHILVIFAVVKECTAYCYGYCWYGSWYIWFAVIMTLAIGCGALGSYLRRRRMQQAILRTQHAEVHTVQVSGNIQVGMMPPTSDLSRPYVYPQGAYPTQPNVGPMTPPPYAAAVNSDGSGAPPTKRPEDLEGLPPSYVEAIQTNNAYQPHPYPGQQPQAPHPGQPQGPPLHPSQQAQALYPGQQPQPYPLQPQAPPYQPDGTQSGGDVYPNK